MKPFYHKLQAILSQKPYLRKILTNINWLILDKILRMGVGLFVGAWMTRYLGPEQFGLLNYALAIISFLISFSLFGLNSTTVKNLINQPDKKNEILGSSCFVQTISSYFVFSVLLIFIFYFTSDHLSQQVMLIIGLAIIFKPMDTIRYYYEANTQSKYIVWAENLSFILCSCIKVIFILSAASFITVVWIFFIDGLITSLFILYIYFYHKQSFTRWKINYSLVKKNIKDGLPLAFSGLTIMIYMRIDQIMLGHILDYSAVGIYTSASKLSEIWYFIPMVIVSSVNPTLLSTRAYNEQAYYKQLKIVTSALVIISLFIALATSFCSDIIIQLLYGEAYQEAANVLVIHIWTGIFVSLGIISGQWLISENHYLLHLYRSLSGAIINIILNFLLIPALGIIGAAIATLVAQISSTLIFDLFNKKSRPMFWIKLSCLNPLYSIKALINLKKSFNQ